MLKVYKKLLFYVPRERYLALIAILLTALSTFLTAGAYYVMYRFLSALIVRNDSSGSAQLALLITGLLLSSSAIYITGVLLTHVLGFRLETNLRKKGIDGLTNASFRFFERSTSGRTRQLIDDNAAQTHTIVAHLIPDNTGALLSPILAIAVGFFVSFRVGAALVAITLLGTVALFRMMGEKQFMRIYQAALEKMNSETVEYVRGMQVVKIFGSGINSFRALRDSITEYSRYALDYSMSCRSPYLLFQLMFLGSAAIVTPLLMLFTDVYAAPAQLTVQLIMFTFLSGVLFTSFMRVMYVSMYAFQGTAAVEKLEALFDDMQRDRLQFGTETHFANYDIEFDRVSFAYDKEPVLEELSFRLPAGHSYALVGSSGSGKSTIAKLISGFYPIRSGEIRIGGRSLSAYTEQALIQAISFVFQDSRLFKQSIFDNVRAGRENASEEEVLRALQLAGCDPILDKFPAREHTMIGAKGVFLSGGERQRIAIARAILKDAPIIIMDEASAAVDPENEHELQKAFANLMRGKTVIMIAHRLSSIRAVDEILVIENGRIAERGSDRALMEQKGLYCEFQTLYSRANDWKVCE